MFITLEQYNLKTAGAKHVNATVKHWSNIRNWHGEDYHSSKNTRHILS
jgi:hypothetical protein